MGKFDGILFCTDLDGTLFKNDKTVSTKNVEAIEYFKREGGYFTIITGRTPAQSASVFKSVTPNAPYGAINGGAVYDGKLNEYVWKYSPLKNYYNIVSEVENRLKNVGFIISTYTKTYYYRNNGAMERYRKSTNTPNLICHYANVNEPVAKILFCTDSESEMQSVIKILNEHENKNDFDFIRSEKILYEILPKGQNKGLPLKIIADSLNVDIKKTVAVGDYYNDIPMLKSAGVGIAVSNAVKEVKDVASYITTSNEEDAIYHVICDIESGKIKFE